MQTIKITYEKNPYHLGSYACLEDAVAARKEAERQLAKDARSFVAKQQAKGVSI